MRKTTTFADPKTDVIFKRIFGGRPSATEAYRHLLVELLNALLELEEGQRILDVTYLPPEQTSPLPGMKFSVVDVKCRDEGGDVYVVEMQVLNVEAFEKRCDNGGAEDILRSTLLGSRNSEHDQTIA